MSNIVAGIGRAQLTVLHERVQARRAVFDRYQEALGDVPGVGFMPEAPNGYCNRWLTVMTLDPAFTAITPMQIIGKLESENIESRPVWKPMHLQPLFAGCKIFADNDREIVADELFANGLCLPSGSNMTEDVQSRVIDCVKRCLGVCKR
jgi:pyridoxal phosphate-dependent aminotransferase EpsN